MATHRPSPADSTVMSSTSDATGRAGSRPPTTSASASSTGHLHGVLSVGGVEALLMRSQLAVPNNTLITAEHYNQLVTMHGTTMIFLFVVPVWAGFANYMVPLMIGARDMAFPRLNALSYWLFVAGGVVFYSSVFWNPPDAGWFSYTPLSNGTYSPTAGQDTWIYLIHLTGLASMLGAINIVVTIATMRAPRDGLGAYSAVLLGCFDTSDHADRRDPGDRSGGHDAAHRPALSTPATSTRAAAARRCSGSTCSGSSVTRRCTS